MSNYKNEKFSEWTRNVRKEYRDLSTEEIRAVLAKSRNNFSCLMTNFVGDFNIGTLVRNVNSFNGESLYYYGNKKWDRRGAVGTQNYTDVKRILTFDELVELKYRYRFVVFEIAESSTLLYDYEWKQEEMSLMIFGEEGSGVPEEIMELADDVVEIPQYGSIPSLNVGTASGIAMYDFCKKVNRGC